MKYNVEYVSGEEIPEYMREYSYGQLVLKITYNDGTSNYYSDEDVLFSRDLSWIKDELEKAYNEGYSKGCIQKTISKK